MSVFDIEGFSYAGWEGSSRTLGSKDTLDRMQKNGGNAVAIIGTSVSIASHTASTVTNDENTFRELEQVLFDAEARGLEILLKPHLSIKDGSSTTSLAPENVSTFFSTYKAMLLDYARMAEKYDVSALSIGNEMDSLVGQPSLSYWTDIIQSIRKVYSGQLTYASTWTHPAETAFLKELDFIGVNPYLPISKSVNPTYQEIVDGWTKAPAADTWQARAWDGASFVDHLHNLSKTFGKAVVLTEVGYPSGERAAIEPGDATNPGSPSQGLQALLYRAFFDVWSAQSDWMKGCYLWAWAPLTEPSMQEISWGTNYDIRGKLAESVVRDAFGEPTTNPTLDGPTSSITLKVAGDSWNGNPEVAVAVDGLIVGRALITANPWFGEWEDVTFTGNFRPNGPGKVEVFFANDAYGGPDKDRNLYVASITVDGRTIAASDGDNAAGSTNTSGATLGNNGAITFHIASDPNTAGVSDVASADNLTPETPLPATTPLPDAASPPLIGDSTSGGSGLGSREVGAISQDPSQWSGLDNVATSASSDTPVANSEVQQVHHAVRVSSSAFADPVVTSSISWSLQTDQHWNHKGASFGPGLMVPTKVHFSGFGWNLLYAQNSTPYAATQKELAILDFQSFDADSLRSLLDDASKFHLLSPKGSFGIEHAHAGGNRWHVASDQHDSLANVSDVSQPVQAEHSLFPVAHSFQNDIWLA